ncbi:hypothetical protein EMIHUDRAFT_125051, partial [Emiliania huxleyi CCMP1516]|uniref:Uncharacterized protein n=4 Tax=Emiliania huxleyi TaxID=2903 RepID=A0A0D3I972_EMIH1
LKEIFDEVGVSYKGLSKDALKAKAYKEGVMRKYWEKYPDKKYKKPKGSGMPGLEGLGGDFGPGGKYEDMMRQMRGDFSAEKDPERRRILEKLAAKGMSFAGGASQSTEELKKMEKMLDGINLGGFGKGDGGAGAAPAAEDRGEEPRETSEMEEVEDEDKVEL